MTEVAATSEMLHTHATPIYTDARTRKKRHPYATRILASAWLRVIWARWRDGACYAPGIHQTNGRSTQPTTPSWRHRG